MGSLLSSRIVTVADFVTPEVIKVINPCCKLEKNHVHGYFSVQCLFTGYDLSNCKFIELNLKYYWTEQLAAFEITVVIISGFIYLF